jgi:hypothetical protein
MKLWRTYESRGLVPNHYPCVDFGLVDEEGTRLALSSHRLC